MESAVITQLFGVDWALVSISLFNALLLIWLGLTVVLNAERRDWGVRLVVTGFMSGALFFVCHTVIIGHELTIFGSNDLEGWWRVGWYPVVLAPFAWYMVILWYVGFWEGQSTRFCRLHRPMVWLLTTYTLLLAALLTFTHPLPSYVNLTLLDFSGTTAIAGIPILLLLYPPFGWLCIVLSLDALRHPAPSQRMMGDLARRARASLAAGRDSGSAACRHVGSRLYRMAHSPRSYLYSHRLRTKPVRSAHRRVFRPVARNIDRVRYHFTRTGDCVL
jgi:hypothetical protein